LCRTSRATQTLPTLIYTFTQIPGGDPAHQADVVIGRDLARRDLASEAFVKRVGKRVKA
jgi:hypothetical protein